MIRLLLLLAILGSLALFAIQNLAPVSLVILGVPTLAIPLSFWVLGAIGAGALTTIVMAGLIELSRPVKRVAAPPRPENRPIGDSPFGELRSNRFSRFRTGGWSAAASETGRSNPRRSANRGDDWDSPAQDSAAWDDWEEPASRSAPAEAAQTPLRDREDAAWSDWQGYENSPRRQPPPDAEPIPYRDSYEPRTDFETDRQPTSRSQTGSVYSYSYRPDEEPDEPIEDEPPPSRSNSVYDAEFRVIAPPFRPDPGEVSPPPPRAAGSNSDGEWDFVDEDDEDWERKR